LKEEGSVGQVQVAGKGKGLDQGKCHGHVAIVGFTSEGNGPCLIFYLCVFLDNFVQGRSPDTFEFFADTDAYQGTQKAAFELLTGLLVREPKEMLRFWYFFCDLSLDPFVNRILVMHFLYLS